MSMHLKNSRDMMTTEEIAKHNFGKLRHMTDSENGSRTSSVDTEDWGWWTSKTSLEQKLVILSSTLFVLSFCLTISVIVLANKKPPACGSTTLAPSTETPTETATETATETTTGPTTTVKKDPEENKPPPEEEPPEKKEEKKQDEKY